MDKSYKEVLEYILKFMVDNPKDVVVTEQSDGSVVDLLVKANKDDYGTIIGRQGQMIQNIRRLLTVKAVKDQVKINIKIDDDGPQKEAPQQSEATKEDQVEEQVDTELDIDLDAKE